MQFPEVIVKFGSGLYFFFLKSNEIVFEMNVGVVNYSKIQEGIVACELKRTSGLIFASLESLNSDFRYCHCKSCL